MFFLLLAERSEERARVERWSVFARRDVVRESPSHAFQIANFALDPRERIGRAMLNDTTRPPGVTPKREQVGDLLERESQILGAPNEPNALNDVSIVPAIARQLSRWGKEQSTTFIVPEGLNTHTRFRRNFSNPHGRCYVFETEIVSSNRSSGTDRQIAPLVYQR